MIYNGKLQNGYTLYNDKIFSWRTRVWKAVRPDKDGYLLTNLYDNDTRKKVTVKIHRAVCECYHPNPNNLPQVDHINRIKWDNRPDNLRWVSAFENGQNRGADSRNTSGFKHISKKNKSGWVYARTYKGKYKSKYFSNKIDALAFKFIIILKIKSNLY